MQEKDQYMNDQVLKAGPSSELDKKIHDLMEMAEGMETVMHALDRIHERLSGEYKNKFESEISEVREGSLNILTMNMDRAQVALNQISVTVEGIKLLV